MWGLGALAPRVVGNYGWRAPILALLLGTLPDGEGKETKFAVNESGVAVDNVRQAPTHRGMELQHNQYPRSTSRAQKKQLQ